MNAGQSHPVALLNGTVITPFRVADRQTILLEDGKIARILDADTAGVPADTRVIDLAGLVVTPGFVDLHIHGAEGASFNDPDEARLDGIAQYAVRHGTTRLLATLYPDDGQRFLSAIDTLAAYTASGRGHGVLHGIHLEGPFLNRQMKGAMNADCLWPATQQNWARLADRGRGLIRMMTVAPELDGVLDVMQAAARSGVLLAIAHSKARYEDIELAIDNGLSQVTHMFNAMDPMHHRKPGIVTAALLKRELKIHLIADGIHVHPAVIALLYRLKGVGGIVLVTDAIRAAGCEDGVHDLAGRSAVVRDGAVYLQDGTLAGSTLTMPAAVRTMVQRAGVPLAEAVRMATLNPARALGLDARKGIVAAGKDADLVVLDRDFNVRMTIIGGNVVFRSS